MDRITVRCTSRTGALPAYQTEGAAGADLLADLPGPIEVAPGARSLIPTGLRLEIPPGFEAQVRPRSGLALRHGITVANAPGTVDSDYRGEVKVLLVNLGDSPYTIRPGDRIAQIVFAPIVRASLLLAGELTGSERDPAGFGSTGVRGNGP